MLDKAIEKIHTEMNKNTNNQYIQVVGDFLLQHLQKDPGAADKILSESKTIAGSLEDMRTQASKRQVNRCGMFTPQEGFEIVLKYFGIIGEPIKVDTPVNVVPAVKPGAKNTEFNVNLDDLL